MKDFRTLNYAMSIYDELSKLRLGGVMQNQFDRALLSVCLNLSEGSGRPTRRDRQKFYFISYASLKEVRTILRLKKISCYDKKIDCLAAHIWKLAINPGGR